MTRNLILFLATFLVGAVGALVTRAALYAPHETAPAQPPTESSYAPMVSTTSKTHPTAAPAQPPAPPSSHASQPAPAHEHTAAGHDHGAGGSAAAKVETVNSVCAICGMPVDPSIPTAEYQGKKIGFGCRMCPPKFKAEPDTYGPFYLRNQVIEP